MQLYGFKYSYLKLKTLKKNYLTHQWNPNKLVLGRVILMSQIGPGSYGYKEIQN